MMTWRERIQTATWRGVPFHVDDTGDTFGRRTVTHTYPDRDIPFTEDLGRKDREFTVAGFVTGDDYMTQRDVLIAACEAPGPGTLVHPYYGRLTVNLRQMQGSQRVSEGGVYRFNLTFVEAGLAAFPVITRSTTGEVEVFADAVSLASKILFAAGFILDGPGYIRDQIESAITDYHGRLVVATDPLFQTVDALNGFKEAIGLVFDDVATTLDDPPTFADGLEAAFALVQSVPLYQAILDLLDVSAFNRTGTTANDIQTNESLTAFSRLTRRAALAPYAKTLTEATFASADAALAARDDFHDRCGAELEATEDGEFYSTLTDLRAAVFETMTETARSLPRTREVTLDRWLPTVVWAYQLYADADRHDELVELNALQHPWFTPALRPLKVLSR